MKTDDTPAATALATADRAACQKIGERGLDQQLVVGQPADEQPGGRAQALSDGWREHDTGD